MPLREGYNMQATALQVPKTAILRTMFSKHIRTLTAALCLAGFVFAPIPANAQKPTIRRDLSKEFKDLTPSEQIAIRAAAKAAYKDKKLDKLVVCADPGNVPSSSARSIARHSTRACAM